MFFIIIRNTAQLYKELMLLKGRVLPDEESVLVLFSCYDVRDDDLKPHLEISLNMGPVWAS